MTKKDESVVLRECMELLRIHNIYSWRNNTGAVKIGSRFVRFGYKGSSDILGITKDGRFLAVECKRENGGVLSQDQKNFLFNITKNGGVAICVHSVEELNSELIKRKII